MRKGKLESRTVAKLSPMTSPTQSSPFNFAWGMTQIPETERRSGRRQQQKFQKHHARTTKRRDRWAESQQKSNCCFESYIDQCAKKPFHPMAGSEEHNARSSHQSARSEKSLNRSSKVAFADEKGRAAKN